MVSAFRARLLLPLPFLFLLILSFRRERWSVRTRRQSSLIWLRGLLKKKLPKKKKGKKELWTPLANGVVVSPKPIKTKSTNGFHDVFLTVAFRMLAKAGWTKSMISLDTKQAALFAISKRWYVKIEAFEDCPFTREELAVSAATYLNQIPADTPDDPLRAINIIVSFLPTCCTKLFSQGTLTCPFCMACCETSIPTVISNVSWTMEGWVDLATTLKQADPIPWEFQHGWHREDCDRSDHLACVTSWGSWILLELQLSKPEFFPPLLESLQLPSDQSLSTLDARVIGLVCSNKKNCRF